MNNSILLIVIGIFISVNVLGQTKDADKTFQDSFVVKASELHPNLDFTIGYVPKSRYNALKTSFSVNNIILKRVGVFTSIEKGLDYRYFSNTYGITSSITKYTYLWGGIGWFSKSQLFEHVAWNRMRKELGIGLLPYKLTVIRLGWSIGIGPTFSAGIKVPL